MSKHTGYFVVELWEDVPGQDDRLIHARIHIGTESGLRKLWLKWNEEHPNRMRYDRIISRRMDHGKAIEDLHRHMIYASHQKMTITL